MGLRNITDVRTIAITGKESELRGMNEVIAGGRLQFRLFRRSAGQLQIFATIPLFTAILLSTVRWAGNPGMESYAAIAPALMGVWLVSLDLAGSAIDAERTNGTLELFLSAPARFTFMIGGRVAVISSLFFLMFAESWTTARVVFDADISVYHFWPLVMTLAATALATFGVATSLSAMFVVARSARVYANALGYPFYLLSGVMVPVSSLPSWLHPVSKVIYLTWAADLLRSTVRPDPVADLGGRLTALLLLGVCAYAVGLLVVERLLRRLKQEGTVTLS
ncbi:hypothetical protein GCM10010260_12700 [Streptomyces filipinensis]|uniref:ABC-2 type transporter transmembrane domain-containing protein n=2 Tax=Streptomyces filipinensis TaxID=66887 RepID=A0A918M8N3_9ACTN|nr:hypothetical protein GCM10010260_12700 [Streptomyces filipinensis]